jgi:predicted nucleic acid-binding protein
MTATAKKISVSLSAEDLSWAKQRAKREVKSLSAVVSEALRRQRQAEARSRLLAELGTDDISERDREQVRSEWSVPLKGPRQARRASKRARKS